MSEIHPVSLFSPVLRPKKIDRDDHRPEKQQPGKKTAAEQQDAEPIQHIDEIV